MPRKSGAGLTDRALTESRRATARELLRQLEQGDALDAVGWRSLGLREPMQSWGETEDEARVRTAQMLADVAGGVLTRVADPGGFISRSSDVAARTSGSSRFHGATTVELSAAAHRFIRAELEDGLETGGALLGYERSDGMIVIGEAGGPQPDARRTPRSIEQSYDRFVTFEQFYRDRDLPSRFCGDWHTQPENGTPSNADLRGWQAFYRSEVGFYVGLIASPQRPDSGAFRWLAAPQLDAWVIRRDGGVFSRDPVDVTIVGAA
jgi:integrative and conjugative element protein (TIGR02256 family)